MMAEDGQMKGDEITKGSIPERRDSTPAAARSAGRRGFLAGAGAAGVAGAAVLATRGNAPAVPAGAAADAVSSKPVGNRGYHETDHVRKYYDTAKV
jgi:outer membrane lipoprotein SlyB